MVLYVVQRFFPYEGWSEAMAVFDNKNKADEYISTLAGKYIRPREYDIFELELNQEVDHGI